MGLSETYSRTALEVGFFFPAPKWLDMGLLGSCGVHTYKLTDSSWGTSGDPGTSASIGAVGARGILAYAYRMSHFGLSVGLHAFVDMDLVKVSRTYSYMAYDDWSGRSSMKTVNTSAGTTRTGALFAFGVSF
jgi:hypothetical protein